jgi:alpha-aminoadipic semialdehyde synthase
MVLLHHEVEVEYPNSQTTEKRRATLLEFGKIADGKTTTAMALTVGIPAAVGALVLLPNPFLFSKLLQTCSPSN